MRHANYIDIASAGSDRITRVKINEFSTLEVCDHHLIPKAAGEFLTCEKCGMTFDFRNRQMREGK